MVTIQAVEVTPDYAHAKVFYSLLVGDPEETTLALNQAAGFLRNGLFKRLHIHTVPTLHFQFDRTTERAADMNALIARKVDRARLRAKGYGEYCPEDPGHNEEAWAKNRRVEFKIVKTKDGPTGVELGCDTANRKGVKPDPVP